MRRGQTCLSSIVLTAGLCCYFGVSSSLPATAAATACRAGNPLASVSNAARYKVLSVCARLSGVVKNVRHVKAGGYQIDVLLDRGYRQLLSDGNVRQRHGWLLVEVTTLDSAKRAETFTTGAHIQIVGALLLDRKQGWNEIYPVWSIQRIGHNTPKPSGSAGGGGNGQPQPAPATAAPLYLHVVVSPAVMPRAYSHAVATAYTQAGASCNASLTYDHGSNPLGALFGFAGQTAGADGTVTWSWGLDFTITGGGSVKVTCTKDGNTATAVGRFTIN